MLDGCADRTVDETVCSSVISSSRCVGSAASELAVVIEEGRRELSMRPVGSCCCCWRKVLVQDGVHFCPLFDELMLN